MTHIQGNEEIVDEILKSDPMRRIMGAEDLLMKTGRMGEYYGMTIQETLLNVLTIKDQQIATAIEKERERIRPFVDRVRLDVEVIKCDCGEPYKDSDLDISVGELEAALISLPTKDSI